MLSYLLQQLKRKKKRNTIIRCKVCYFYEKNLMYI